MKYECFKNDCYNLYTIKTDKFKSSHIEVIFKNNFNKENITYSALLFDSLMENTKEYNTKKTFLRKLESLYNTNIYSTNTRIGTMLLTSINVDFLNPKYMTEESLEEIIKVLGEVIFNPNVECEEFDEETFDRLKKKLYEEIESVKENLKEKSILDALKEIDPGIRSQICSGNIEVLKEITPKKLYKFYQKTLEESEISVYAVGNIDMKKLDKLFKKYFKFTSITSKKGKLFLDELNNKKTLNISKKSDDTQLNFVQIYSLNKLDYKEENYVMPIFNLLWGSGSLESKLYKQMRSENSLCYGVNTLYQKYDRILIVHSAIDKENYEKAIKIIKNTLNEMAKGNITIEELDSVKKILTNSLKMAYDSPNRLIDNYLFKNLANLDDIEKRIEEFNKVTIQDLIKISKKIKLLINYRIGG